MSKGTMTVEGFVSNEPQLNTTQGGKSVISVTVPHTRSKRQDDGTWQDQGGTTWAEATFWEDEAQVVAQQVQKGTKVIVTGDPEVQVYAKRDGSSGAKVVLRFPTLGVVPRAPRQGGQSGGGSNWGGQQGGGEPWAPQGGQQPQQDTGWSQPGGTYDDETPF
ncbi:single-stranded DNA-binding protein [Curtobacterium sp. Curtsp57]|uniref:single-stranded DNA-binding protein n=1 Tax=Curtobacterium sp. Curtsp57 TaxID=3243047 RepID=UPI0039B51CB1